tara:strand:+ start:116 stop:1039 length:924 start_codon:yes stop_codon:yes gene_type:complete
MAAAWLLWPAVQATASDTSGCVFVSNDHGDALEEWLRATAGAVRPLAVFHVDAHNDLNVPEGREPLTSPASSAELRRRWQHNSTLLHQLTAGVDLANFQLAAVRAGVVDRIVWVRQSSPGDGAQALHSVHSLRFEDGAFDDDEVYSSTSYDPVAEAAALAQASVHGIGFAFHEVPEHALSQPQLVRQLADLLDAQGYIIDIDLDFFAHGARPDAKPRASRILRPQPSPRRPPPPGAMTHFTYYFRCGSPRSTAVGRAPRPQREPRRRRRRRRRCLPCCRVLAAAARLPAVGRSFLRGGAAGRARGEI